MENKIRVAFIGAGYMAAEHVKAFSDISDVELSGVYSRTRARAEEFATDYSIKYVCESIGDLFDKTQADLVIFKPDPARIREQAIKLSDATSKEVKNSKQR